MKLLTLFASLVNVIAIGSGLIEGGDRVLIIHDETSDFKVENLAQHLSDSGYSITVSELNNNKLTLSAFGDYIFDTVVLLAPNARRLVDGTATLYDSSTEGVGQKELIRYVDDGGNLVIAGGDKVSAPIRQLVNQFSMDFMPDIATVTLNGAASVALNLATLDTPFVANYGAPLMVNRSTPLRLSPTSRKIETLIPAPEKAIIQPPAANVDKLAGSAIPLVSAMHTDVGSRVTILASTDFLSDSTVETPTGKEFARRLLDWAAGRSHVLRMSPISHRLADLPAGTPGLKMYREGIDIHAEFTLEVRQGDSWTPYYEAKDQVGGPVKPNDADDDYGTNPSKSRKANSSTDKPSVQVSFVMLDPYVRTLWPLERRAADGAAVYGRDFRVPDKCGIFKFVVDYKEKFMNRVKLEQVLPIRNFRHDDYPRFLVAAYPYYATELAVLLMTVLFAVVFLFHKESKGQVRLVNVEAQEVEKVIIPQRILDKYAPTAAQKEVSQQ